MPQSTNHLGKLVCRATLVMALGVSVAVVLGNLHQNEDLIMALLAGRDVLDGHLADSDMWSFTTGGKVWVNQGWLSGLAFFLSYMQAGEAGPVLMKALLLVICIVLVYRRCSRLGVSTDVALIATTVGTFTVAPLLSIRAENFGILYFVILSTLLTRPPSPGIWRHLGSVVVMMLWTNSHGSFIMGFGLIAAKAMVQFLRHRVGLHRRASDQSHGDSGMNKAETPGSRIPHGHEPPPCDHKFSTPETVLGSPYGEDSLKWAVTCLLCIPVMAFANPYGTANLYMPFRQTGAELWTHAVDLWQPLIQLDESSGLLLYMGKLSLFYVSTIVLFVVMSIFAMLSKGWAQTFRCLLKGGRSTMRGDLLMETIISLMTILVTFRFGRTTAFAGLAIVPPLAFVFQHWVHTAGVWLSERFRSRAPFYSSLGFFLFSFTLLGLVAWFFSFSTLPPYLPNNPLFRTASTIARAFGTPPELDNLTRFIEKNRINGRVFSDLLLSDLLLLHVPNITVFMDLRAQSIYTDDVCRQYLSVALVNPRNAASVAAALATLDRRSVSTVVLPTDSEYWLPLIATLLDSRIWLPLYADTSGYVFVKSQSFQLKEFRQTGRVDKLWFPSERAKLLTRASLMLSSRGRIEPEVVEALKNVAVEQPATLIYQVIARSGRDDHGCLSGACKSYLLSEFNRLSHVDFIRPGGYESILGSMMEILRILHSDALACAGRGNPHVYEGEMVHLQMIMGQVRKRYSPWPYD